MDLNLTCQLYSLKMTNHQVAHHLSKLKDMCVKLACIGKKIEDKELVHISLHTRLGTYRPFIWSLDIVDKIASISMVDLGVKLLLEK